MSLALQQDEHAVSAACCGRAEGTDADKRAAGRCCFADTGVVLTSNLGKKAPTWRNFEVVEFATLTRLDGFNNRRPLEPIGNVPPVEAEESYFAMLNEQAMAA